MSFQASYGGGGGREWRVIFVVQDPGSESVS